MTCATAVDCKHDGRRNDVRHKEKWYGLDYLEVSDDQLTLSVYFLGKAPPVLYQENFRIEGGRRLTGIQVTSLEIHREDDPQTDDCVHITVDRPGDFSNYCLCVVEIDPESKLPIASIDGQCHKGISINFSPHPSPLPVGEGIFKGSHKTYQTLSGFDPRYACLEFSFKASCSNDLDCLAHSPCLPEKPLQPEINYLAKDYASFRQLMLDRLALTMPDWQERHVPDLGITLVELLAYVGDHLSYYQDAVATEAYLDTARRRVSVRRHVRLVDYQLHEGCNARAWVSFQVSDDFTAKADDFYLITHPGLAGVGNVLAHSQLPQVTPRQYLVFEPLLLELGQAIRFYEKQNTISIYTWGDTECCLGKGATSATLLDPGVASTVTPGHKDECTAADAPVVNEPQPPFDSDYLLHLQAGDFLVFEEVKGPKTGNPADADPKHRHAVRLLKANKSQDPLTGQLLWEVAWALADALPFALCLSAIKQDDCSLVTDVSVVRGNVILVDHGETINDATGLEVPGIDNLSQCADACVPREIVKIADSFTPYLGKSDVTFRVPLWPSQATAVACSEPAGWQSANSLLTQDVRQALPAVTLQEMASDGLTTDVYWEPRLELLSSSAEDRHFVLEVDDDRRAKLRFGNSESGLAPEAGWRFQVAYRIGNGTVGNVGAEAISHIVFKDTPAGGINFTLRNPLPARGGSNPEPVSEAKLYAPQAFRKQLQRAVTADDYAQIVMRDFSSQVQRAVAKLLWTGSWYQVLVAIDPLGTEQADAELLCAIKQHLCRYHRIGHDVVVQAASYVPLELAMTVCVLPHYLRGQVKAALLEVFSNGIKPDGGKGFFHPDNLSFGDGVYVSQLLAAAQAVEGVESVVVTKLERFLVGPNQELDQGLLALAPFEVAQLDNDASFPENGKFTLVVGGGR